MTAYADALMEALLRVFACHPGSVHEEAMLAVGALTYACGPQFVKYMERFYPILESGLKNYQVRRATMTSAADLRESCSWQHEIAFGDTLGVHPACRLAAQCAWSSMHVLTLRVRCDQSKSPAQ